MNTKLTLNLNKAIIEEAKSYAKSNNVSLSKLIENYLNSLVIKSNKSSRKISPLVESLTGVISSEVDERKSYRDYLSEKYS
jgi:ribosomal protein S20